MADTAVHSFTEKTTLVATDEFYLVQSPYGAGDDRRVSLANIGAYFAKNTLAAGTLTDSAPMTLTQTWNDAADTFVGLSLDITSTNSAAASSLFRVRIGGLDAFSVRKDGVGIFPLNSILVTGTLIASANLALQSDNSTIQVGASADVVLRRDGAANTLAQRNGTAAQTLNVYNTFTDASNYERAVFDWALSANVLTIGTTNAGSGSARNMRFVIGGTSKADYGITRSSEWTFTARTNITGNFYATGNIQFGQSAAVPFVLLDPQGAGTLLFKDGGGGATAILRFAGDTSSFPALKRSSAALIVRLADDSADAELIVGSLRINQTPTTVSQAVDTTINSGADGAGNIGHRISFNANGTTYYIPCSSVAF